MFVVEDLSSTVPAVFFKQCGWEKCSSLHHYGPISRDHYLIHYVVNGSGWYQLGEKRYELEKGQGFIIFPNQTTLYCASEHDPWEYYWVGYVGPEAGEITTKMGLTPQSPVFSNPDIDGLRTMVISMYNDVVDHTLNGISAHGWLYRFLSSIAGKTFSVRFKEHSESPSRLYLNKAIWYIDNHYTQPLTVSDVANFVGLSRSQLFRVFTTMINESPKAMIVNARLACGSRLLRETSLSINEIAEYSGFIDSSRFSFYFKKKYGMTPSQYRGKALISKHE